MAVQVHGKGKGKGKEGDAASEFFRFLQQNPRGVTEENLIQAGWHDKGIIAGSANTLLGQGKIELQQIARPSGQPSQLVYRLANQQKAKKLQGLDDQHRMLLQFIEDAGNKGAWSKTLKDKSNLAVHNVTKIIKELLKRQLIKEVKSVQHKARKVYMLIDVEPHKEVTGGTWYHEGEFAVGWVDTLREHCQAYFEEHKGASTAHEIHEFIIEQPCGHSVPSEEEVAAILNTLRLDEEIYTSPSTSGELMYQRIKTSGSAFDLFAARLPSFYMEKRSQPDEARSMEDDFPNDVFERCNKKARPAFPRQFDDNILPIAQRALNYSYMVEQYHFS